MDFRQWQQQQQQQQDAAWAQQEQQQQQQQRKADGTGDGVRQQQQQPQFHQGGMGGPGLVNYILGFSPAGHHHQAPGGVDAGLLMGAPARGGPNPLVTALVGADPSQQQQPDGGPYGSSSSILYATLDGSRSSLAAGGSSYRPGGGGAGASSSGLRGGPPTPGGSGLYASGAYGSAGLGGDSLSRSDFASYLGSGSGLMAGLGGGQQQQSWGPPGSGAGGGGAHSVEALLEVLASLPPGQDAALLLGPRLQHLDSSALAALMKELGRVGLGKRSVELFDFLRRQQGPEYAHLLDIYTYTTAIAVCGTSQQLQRALELVAEMRAHGITCNVHTYSALMNVCIKCNEVGLVQQVYAQMIQEGCSPNLVTYNTLIDLHVKTGQWQEALKLLDRLEAEGIRPEVRTYNTIITACNKSGRPEEGLRVYERMVAAGVAPSATTYTALISAYGKQGKVEKAMEIFADMGKRGAERNVITYSSLISACEKAGRCELALQLFERMHKEGCAPNVVTYNSLIAACSHGGHWEKAKECFNQMLAQGCRPDGITYSALIAAYQRGSQAREALQAFSHMPASGCHPDSVVYNALLEVAWSSGVLLLQMRATQIWSLANRSGHFRIYNQTKGDPSVHQHSCVVFTVGAAVVTLLRWLCDVRHKMGNNANSLMRERVVFCLQKGKASRVEQPSALICDAVGALLAGHGSPFRVRLVEATTQLEAASAELAAWLHSPAFAPLAYLVHANSARRMSVEQLVAEDAALEKSCTDALAFVQTYEQLRGYSKQVTPNTLEPLGAATRVQLLDLARHYATCFRLPPEVMYDGWELLQRLLMAGATPPLGASGGEMWRLMMVACMLTAARQAGGGGGAGADGLLVGAGGLPPYDVIALNVGVSADSIINTEQNVLLVLGSDAAAVSALRVAQVLLERLGGGHQEPRQAALLADDLGGMMRAVACSSALFKLQPSLMAQGLVYCLRKKRGLVPLWPAALVQLTGVYDPTVGDLGLLVQQQLLPLLGLDEQEKPPEGGAAAAATGAAAAAAPAAGTVPAASSASSATPAPAPGAARAAAAAAEAPDKAAAAAGPAGAAAAPATAPGAVPPTPSAAPAPAAAAAAAAQGTGGGSSGASGTDAAPVAAPSEDAPSSGAPQQQQQASAASSPVQVVSVPACSP